MFGKGGAGGLTASARTCEIFVFNLSGDTSDDDLQSFFVKINVMVAELECRSKPDALARSYRVRIALDDIAKVMNPDIWPEGVGCRMYYRAKRDGVKGVNSQGQNGL